MRRTSLLMPALLLRQTALAAVPAFLAAFFASSAVGLHENLRVRPLTAITLLLALLALQASRSGLLYGFVAVLPPTVLVALAFALLSGPVSPLLAGAVMAAVASAAVYAR